MFVALRDIFRKDDAVRETLRLIGGRGHLRRAIEASAQNQTHRANFTISDGEESLLDNPKTYYCEVVVTVANRSNQPLFEPLFLGLDTQNPKTVIHVPHVCTDEVAGKNLIDLPLPSGLLEPGKQTDVPITFVNTHCPVSFTPFLVSPPIHM